MLRIRKLSSSISDLLSSTISRPKKCDDGFTTKDPLHLAVVSGNIQRIKYLVDECICEVDEEDERGQTPLQLSVLASSSQITEFLIQNGACVDHSDFAQVSCSHLVVKYNKMEQFNIITNAGANFTLEDGCGKSAFDMACEYGRVPMVLQMIKNGVLTDILDFLNLKKVHKTSGLHLAARNGHVEVCHHLIENGFPVNIQTPCGSALHEAIIHKHGDVITLLVYHGIDVFIRNQAGLTVLNIFEGLGGHRNQFNTQLRLLLRYHPCRTYAQALIDYQDPLNPAALSFYEHQLIWVIDNNSPIFWKGIVFEEFGYSRSGVFPPETVRIIDNTETDSMRHVDPRHGMASRMTVRRIKRIEAPVVPDLPGMADFHQRSRNLSGGSRKSSCTIGNMFNDLPSSHSSSSPSSSRAASSCADPAEMTSPTFDARTLSRCEMSVHKPGGLSTFQYSNTYLPDRMTSGRNSTGSNTSSQNSSGFESGKYENIPSSHSASSFISNPNDSPSRSCFANNMQSSSADPCATLDDPNTIDINEMLAKGISDSEILGEWLEKLGLQQYLSSFILQGFDVSSVSKLIAEDLLALGVTDPCHRKIIHADIQNWNVVDGWPRSVSPTSPSSHWLKSIGLSQYSRLFETEGYETMNKVEDLTFEDLEDLGIKKLGHIKRICLALKKLKVCRRKEQELQELPKYNNSDLADSQHTLNHYLHSSHSSLNNDEWRPKLQIITTQQILSATPEFPRSINGEILRVGVEQPQFRHQNPPSPAPEIHSRLPPLPSTARGPFKTKSHDFTRPSTAHLTRSSTFCSASNSSDLY